MGDKKTRITRGLVFFRLVHQHTGWRVFPRGRIHKVFGANGVRSAVPKIKKSRKLASRTSGVEWVSGET